MTLNEARELVLAQPQRGGMEFGAPPCENLGHIWLSDSDDEGRTFETCVRRGGCGKRKVTGTAATRW